MASTATLPSVSLVNNVLLPRGWKRVDHKLQAMTGTFGRGTHARHAKLLTPEELLRRIQVFRELGDHAKAHALVELGNDLFA